jgi:hypothetical protein
VRNKIIIAQTLVIIILAYFLFSGPEVKTEIKTVEKIVKVTDTVTVSKPQKIKKVYVSVPSYSTDTVLVQKEAKEFIYKDTLKNGILNASIFADTIYKRNINLTTFNKETHVEIKKEVFKPVFYVAPSVTMHKLESVKNASLNAFIASRKILIGAGAGLDIETGQPTMNATIGFKF